MFGVIMGVCLEELGDRGALRDGTVRVPRPLGLTGSKGSGKGPGLCHTSPLWCQRIRSSRAESTMFYYRQDFAEFTRYCERHRQQPLPASEKIVCALLSHIADSGRFKSGSIARFVSAISAMHRAAGHESPTKKNPSGS